MNGTHDTTFYIHKDYLGSYDVITDEEGNVQERLSFDPWGRRRNPTDWTFNNVPSPHLFDRGYTGHEHLDIFSLINMNGRAYDPWLGRFLSPDPFVQSPGYSQSYNRYSYCLNNPLKYTDPSGYTYKPDDWDKKPTGSLFYYNPGPMGPIGPGSGDHWSDNISSNMSLPGSYTYDWTSGQYYNNRGEVVSWNEVFVNYVVPNSTGAPYSYYLNNFFQEKNNRSSQNNSNSLAKFYKVLYNKSGMMFYGTLVDVLENLGENQSEGSSIDFLISTDTEKIIHIMNNIRDANNNGNEYIDLRRLFSNFPKYGDGFNIAGSIMIGKDKLSIHMIIAIYDNMNINIYPARVGQVGPFNNLNVRGVIKNGYWDFIELNRAGGSLPIMMIQTDTNFDSFYNFLYM